MTVHTRGTAATDPYGGQWLHEPLDDDYSDQWAPTPPVVHHDPTWRASIVRLPPPRCTKGLLCTLPNYHLGWCNTDEHIETISTDGEIK
jgi:hypothetical protein